MQSVAAIIGASWQPPLGFHFHVNSGFFAPGPFELIILGALCLLFVGVPAIIIGVVVVNRRQAGSDTRNYGRISCPECGESIVAEAVKCRFCGARFDREGDEAAPPPADEACA